jgi:SAM-dependent methyltransferase
MRRLLDRQSLDHSGVVANAAMNRERRLSGTNSYAKDLGFEPLEVLSGGDAWLDLCCGTGRALIEAARLAAGRVEITGVDLVGMFDPVPEGARGLRLVVGSLPAWEPEGGARFRLITCVHGLHYVGDKLEAVRQAVSWLAEDGLFVTHLDPGSFVWESAEPAGKQVLRELRCQGLDYDSRTHRLSCRGPKTVTLPFRYVGADDTTGPNYTGQPAVTSIYRPL